MKEIKENKADRLWVLSMLRVGNQLTLLIVELKTSLAWLAHLSTEAKKFIIEAPRLPTCLSAFYWI